MKGDIESAAFILGIFLVIAAVLTPTPTITVQAIERVPEINQQDKSIPELLGLQEIGGAQ